MVVCKFFQQGNCRYGQNCRFEHVYASKFSYHAPQNGTSSISSVCTDEQLLNQVQSDIQAALKGGQWVLSCYSPFKEKPNFPGLSDLSMEEARLFIYEAKANNNLDQAVVFMNNLFEESKHKYEKLLQPDAAITRVLKSLYKGEVIASPFMNNAQGSFGNSSSATSIFRSAVQGSSTFGQTNTNTSIFGQNNPSNSIFEQNVNVPSVFEQKPSFGTENAKSIFAQASHNIFGQNQTSSVFGQNQTSSVFRQNQSSVFGQKPTSSVFGQNQTSNVFGPSQPSNIFNKGETTAKSIFAQANQNVTNSNTQNDPANIFASASQSVFAPSPFSQHQGNTAFSNHQQTNSPFSSAAPSVFQMNQHTEDNISIYSDIKDLSPSDIECFSADEFKLGFIPEIPPPHSLCF